MRPPSEDIKDILEDGTDLVFGTDLFIGLGPSSPDNVVVIRDSGGAAPETQYTYKYPTVQIYVRNNSYQSGWKQAETIMSCLHALHGEVWGAVTYVLIKASSEIMFLGVDENNRAEFSVNFQIHRTDE